MNEIINLLKNYIDTRTDIIKIDIERHATGFAGKFFKLLVFSFLAMIITLFLSLSLAMFIGDKLESASLGFLVVAGIFFVPLAVIYKNSDKIDANILRYLQEKKQEKQDAVSPETTKETTKETTTKNATQTPK